MTITLKSPATKQDIELRGNRDVLINVPITNTDGTPYLFLADKVVNWYMGSDKKNPIITRTSSASGPTAIQVVAVESRVVIPVLAVDTRGRPRGRFYHEVELVDTSGRKVTVTEGVVTLLVTFDDTA